MFHNGEASYLCLKPRTNPLSFSLSIILFPHSGVKGITSSRKHNSQWTVLCRGSFALAYLSRETWANVIEQCQHWRVVQSQLFKMTSTCRASVDLNRQGYDINSTRGRRETVAMYTVVCVIQDSVHYSFIHFGFKWFKGNTEESRTSDTKQIIMYDAPISLEPDLTWWLAVSDTLTSREPDRTAYQLVPMSPCRNTANSKIL